MNDGLAEITEAASGDVSIIGVRGEIDLSNAEMVEGRIRATARRAVVLDLSEVEYMDSVGIAMLDRASRTVPALHVVAPAHGRVGRLLAMVELPLARFESADDAMTAARESGGPTQPSDG